MLKTLIRKIFGGNKQARDMKILLPVVERINEEYEKLQGLSDEELRKKTEEFRERLRVGETLDDLLPEAYAVVKEACRRHLGKKWVAAGNEITWEMVPFDVQLAGAVILHQGKIAEMATGEGKTLVAIMPLYLNALEGKSAHLVTVNDYLAQRDSEWMGPVFQFLGMTVGCILMDMEPDVRRAMYACDVTYGTNNEFGFDYLRDNIAVSKEYLVQRGHHYAIVDEVDSVLIDESRTPLIISGPVDRSTQRYDLVRPIVEKIVQSQTLLVNSFLSKAEKMMEEEPRDDSTIGLLLLRAKKGAPKNKRLMKHLQEACWVRLVEKTETEFMRDKRVPELEAELFFVVDEKGNNIDITEKGRQALSPDNPDRFLIPDLVDEIAKVEAHQDLTPQEKEKKKEEIRLLHETRAEEVHNISQLLRAYMLFEKDVDYIVQENKVIIVDEFTGRLMPGRRWSDGLHQAVEAKEAVSIEMETQTLATITLQNFFRMYKKLAGMTGTAETEAQEFAHTYKMDVVVIPTNKPVRRVDYADRIFRTKREKYNAIIEEIQYLNNLGLPILVGTVSVEVSELLSRMLKRAGLSHNVLNAKNHAREAEIIRDAGKSGTITIATNMAGRGTDIKLGTVVVKCKRCCIRCDDPCEEALECNGVKRREDYSECLEECKCGLQIIGTERHEARRIDRQLRGRSGRQGDPGASQFFVGFEDDLMRLFGSDRLASVLDWFGAGMKEGEEIQHRRLDRLIEKAQQKVEGINFERRKHTLEYDNVMNKQRETIYGLRREILLGGTEDQRAIFLDIASEAITDEFTKKYGNPDRDVSEWDIPGFLEWLRRTVPGIDLDSLDIDSVSIFDDLLVQVMSWVKKIYEQRAEILGPEVTPLLTRAIMLRVIDRDWQDHLLGIDELREGIHLRSYAQWDPLVEFQREATDLFYEMMYNIRQEILKHFFHEPIAIEERRGAGQLVFRKDELGVFTPEMQAAAARARRGGDEEQGSAEPQVKQQPFRRQGPKVGPNAPCPCGSGKKYKKCCGKMT
jgi:preprotein translocase subunit SecA